jgi:RHS repeat-associated protein
VKATYTYIADGTKASVIDSAGKGFIYIRTMVYTKEFLTKTLESTSFGGGRINKTGNNNYDINYFITDHLGSTRAIVNANNGAITAQYNYYPFGKPWEDPYSPVSTNRYTFSGKEKQTVRNLGWLDFSARMLNGEIPIFTTQDPLAEKYYSISPYAYCAGNPINAIDEKGKAIVFINGMDWKQINSIKALPSYWDGFDKEVMKRFNDNRVIYRDGSIGGLSGLRSESLTHSFNNLPTLGENLSVGNRIESGYEQGKIDAPIFISQLERSDGVITESLRVVTHSMGAAYAKGYIKAILDYARQNPDLCK